MPASTSSPFLPPRRRGMIFHGLAGLMLFLGSAVCMATAIQQQVGGVFVLLLLLSMALFAPLPVVFYRGYALMNASYTLERDGFRIRWGLRAEDIPLTEIEWVRPAAELGFRLPLPLFNWPGAILGGRSLPELGLVEFLASETANLLLVATPDKVFVISPQDVRGFVQAFQNVFEMGSLTPLKPYSARPAAFARRVWDERPARMFLMAGLFLTLALLVLVSLVIPGQTGVSLGFDPTGRPFPQVPPEQLLLLPVLAIFAFMANLAGGLFFYRRDEDRPVAFVLWITSAFTPLLFIIAVILLV